MTPELRRSINERVMQLRARLNGAALGGGLSPVASAQEARQLFLDVDDGTRAHWLDLEIGGYGNLADIQPLHEVLRVSANDRLVAHVAAYRTQRGVELTPGAQPVVFAHFFVESLGELTEARDRVKRSGGTSTLDLGFGSHEGRSNYPARLEFPRDAFERICGGFLAALYLQLAAALDD